MVKEFVIRQVVSDEESVPVPPDGLAWARAEHGKSYGTNNACRTAQKWQEVRARHRLLSLHTCDMAKGFPFITQHRTVPAATASTRMPSAEVDWLSPERPLLDGCR